MHALPLKRLGISIEEHRGATYAEQEAQVAVPRLSESGIPPVFARIPITSPRLSINTKDAELGCIFMVLLQYTSYAIPISAYQLDPS
jgi:hypothetical protein